MDTDDVHVVTNKISLILKFVGAVTDFLLLEIRQIKF